MTDSDNPFAALLQSDETKTSEDHLNNVTTVEDVFGFTLNPENRNRNLVFMRDLSEAFSPEDLTTEDTLAAVLFERLMLSDPQECVPSGHNDNDICETNAIAYLYACYVKSTRYEKSELIDTISRLILRNVSTAFKQPDLFDGQDLPKQLMNVLGDESTGLMFFQETYFAFVKEYDDFESVTQVYSQVLGLIHKEILHSTPFQLSSNVLDILQFCSQQEPLALCIMEYCKPKNKNFENNILGALLNISVLPRNMQGRYKYFGEPADQVAVTREQGVLWADTNRILNYLHVIISNLLKTSSKTKKLISLWLGECLESNVDRGKLWNTQLGVLVNSTTVSDGFMINLCGLFMKFCVPLTQPNKRDKLLSIDPTYCAVKKADAQVKGVCLSNLDKETCLVPVSESEESDRATSSQFRFATELFFMSHRSLDLGFRVVSEKIVRLSQDIVQREGAYLDTVRRTSSSSPLLNEMNEELNAAKTKYLSLNCAMCEPELLNNLFSFVSSTCYWLTQIAVDDDYNKELKDFWQTNPKEIKFPLPDSVPATLKCIPEFVLENVVCYLIFLKRFKPTIFENQDEDTLNPIVTCILMFMGSMRYARNPHLRAHLAEALEALLPQDREELPYMFSSMNDAKRQRLFESHPHKNQIVECLLNVFISIEMTGESVQFEQKFNYRRPMYGVMNYLWKIEDYQNNFKQLAASAERNMEAVHPPIFLKFVNLLMNDATFLLDESLSNMSKLKELQNAKERGEWDSLPQEERAQNYNFLYQTGMMAKFDNILGRDTIHMLQCLTSQITIVFTHSTLVDRVAAMLNYFLLKLVGPNQKDYKVTNPSEYNFDPAATVLNICKIYVNLKASDAFCLAVSQDGRSYSPNLFVLAEDVLVRIKGGTLVSYLREVAAKVAEQDAAFKINEEALAEAPEHFLDPIMSTIMQDPVILPSSKQTVDRCTIARHLLSDQTDPFNRAPLSMDQVIPNTKLADEIKAWLVERKLSR